MTFTAALDGSTATITLTGINSNSNLKIEGATGLGDQLIAFVTDPSTAPVDTLRSSSQTQVERSDGCCACIGAPFRGVSSQWAKATSR